MLFIESNIKKLHATNYSVLLYFRNNKLQYTILGRIFSFLLTCGYMGYKGGWVKLTDQATNIKK